MGIKDLSFDDGRNSSADYAKASDYRKIQKQEAEPIPKWASLDLTQFVAQPYQDAVDTVGDAVDKIVTVLEFIKELTNLYASLAGVALNVVAALIEVIRRLINELFYLLDLDDAGIYALYIPYKQGGTPYYVKTFLDSLNDPRDLNKPTIRDNTYAAATFLKVGTPNLDRDFSISLLNLKEKFFGMFGEFETPDDLAPPQSVSIKALMTPIAKNEAKVEYVDGEHLQEESKTDDSGYIATTNLFIKNKEDTVNSYVTSLKNVSSKPKLNAFVRWQTPDKLRVGLKRVKLLEQEGVIQDRGIQNSHQTNVYKRQTISIASVYIIRAEDPEDLKLKSRITTTMGELKVSYLREGSVPTGPFSASKEIDGTTLVVTKLTAFPFRETYFDDTIEQAVFNATDGTYLTQKYYYRLAYGYKVKQRTRTEVVEYVPDTSISSKMEELANKPFTKTDLGKTRKVLSSTGYDGAVIDTLINSRYNVNWYGEEEDLTPGDTEIYSLFTKTDYVINSALQGDISGTPPDWVSYRAMSDLFPALKAFMDKMQALINNIADSLIDATEAIKDQVEKIAREIEDLVNALIDIVKALESLLFPPITGIYAMGMTTENGLTGIKKGLEDSLNVAGKSKPGELGSQYLVDDPEGNPGVPDKDARYDIVPYFPDDHYTGGFVFLFGSVATADAFNYLLGNDPELGSALEDTWAAHFDEGKLGFNNIKIPELKFPKSRRERRRKERKNATGSVEVPVSDYEGSDGSATQEQSDAARGLIDIVENEVDSSGNGIALSAEKEPFCAPEGITTWAFVVNGVTCIADIPPGCSNAAMIAAAINSAYQSCTGLDGTICRAYAGGLQFNTPPKGFRLDDQSLNFGYSEYSSIIGVTGGETIFGIDSEEDLDVVDANLFGYEPGDYLVQVVGQNAGIPIENICVPAAYKGSMAFDSSDEQSLGPNTHTLKIDIDGIALDLDVTGNGGSNAKHTSGTITGNVIGSGPFIFDNTNNKFYLELLGVPASAALPTGVQVVELLEAQYPDVVTLLNRLLISIHSAGFPLGTFDVYEDSGAIVIALKKEELKGSGISFELTAHPDDGLGILGFTSGDTGVGTDLVKYTIEEVRDNINAAFSSIDSSYSNVCSIVDEEYLRLDGLVKGDEGYIKIESRYLVSGEPPVAVGDEESSLVSEILFGTNPERDYPVEVYGIGTPTTATQLELEIVGQEPDTIISNDHIKNYVMERTSDELYEVQANNDTSYIVEVV
jgi:hypothetical protein